MNNEKKGEEAMNSGTWVFVPPMYYLWVSFN